MLINNNHIHNASKGIWLDWMAQGTRVSNNICYDNVMEDIFLEVNHGPVLLDNNILLSANSVRSISTGEAYVHNLIMGKTSFSTNIRTTPVFKPHSTEKTGREAIPSGDHRCFNNIFVGEGLEQYDKWDHPVYIEGNIYLNGAQAYKYEGNFLYKSDFDPMIRLEKEGNKLYLLMTLNKEVSKFKINPISIRQLGKSVISDQTFENPDLSQIIIDKDYMGNDRSLKHPIAGPFEIKKSGEVKIQIH